MNKKHSIASEQAVILITLDLCDILYEAICIIVSYYELSKQTDNDWFVLLIATFDCYYGNTKFSKKWSCKISDCVPAKEINSGISRIKVNI